MPIITIVRQQTPEAMELQGTTTGLDLFGDDQSIVAMRVDGDIVDLARELPDGATVEPVLATSPEGLAVLRHSSAHVAAQAVQLLRADAKLGIGPPISTLNPQSREIAGAIAMPFIVGPGTISASVIAGTQLGLLMSSLAIFIGLGAALGSIVVFKKIHDFVQTRSERYVERYVEIAGRITALFTGSFAVDMILKGVERWLALIQAG